MNHSVSQSVSQCGWLHLIITASLLIYTIINQSCPLLNHTQSHRHIPHSSIPLSAVVQHTHHTSSCLPTRNCDTMTPINLLLLLLHALCLNCAVVSHKDLLSNRPRLLQQYSRQQQHIHAVVAEINTHINFAALLPFTRSGVFQHTRYAGSWCPGRDALRPRYCREPEAVEGDGGQRSVSWLASWGAQSGWCLLLPSSKL